MWTLVISLLPFIDVWVAKLPLDFVPLDFLSTFTKLERKRSTRGKKYLTNGSITNESIEHLVTTFDVYCFRLWHCVACIFHRCGLTWHQTKYNPSFLSSRVRASSSFCTLSTTMYSWRSTKNAQPSFCKNLWNRTQMNLLPSGVKQRESYSYTTVPSAISIQLCYTRATWLYNKKIVAYDIAHYLYVTTVQMCYTPAAGLYNKKIVAYDIAILYTTVQTCYTVVLYHICTVVYNVAISYATIILLYQLNVGSCVASFCWSLSTDRRIDQRNRREREALSTKPSSAGVQGGIIVI